MIDLKQRQIELQRDSYVLLEERISQLMADRSSHLQSYAKAGGLLSYIQRYIEEVEGFTLEYLQQIIGKVIQQDNDYYAKLLGVEYKNIHDVVAKPLSWVLLNKNRIDEAILDIKNSKNDFKSMDKKYLKKCIQIVVDDLKNSLIIGGDFYNDLSLEESRIFRENPQRVALAIWQLGCNELVNMAMIHLLSLQQKDNADDENSANARQSFGGDIGESIHGRIAWRYFRDMEGLVDESLKSAYRDYENSNFEALEQCTNFIISSKVELEIGQKMLDLALEADIIKEYTKPNTEKNFNYLKLNPKLLEKMNQTDKKIAYGASMVYKPMIIEPLEWRDMYGGGFLLDDNINGRFDLSLIKASNKKDRQALNGKRIPQSILDAINHLQCTAYKINEHMLEVLLDYHNDINYLKKKNRVDFAYYRILREILSAKLSDKSKKRVEQHFQKTKYIKTNSKGELSATDKSRVAKALKAIQKSQSIDILKLDSEIYYEIAKYKQGFDTVIDITREMLEFEAFYFVWRMDFRGRLYPQQTLLHPQAGDVLKSLLLFANEKPLNDEGQKWFFIHGANCYGEVDKEIFQKRIDWVEEHHDRILSSARDYRKEPFWKRAGDPFKFLAWCFEYKRYIDNPSDFTTGMPIAIDGSNNGFQHITALLHDVDGAKKVNVLPSYGESGELKMSDLYTEVAIELKSKMSRKVEKFEAKKADLIEKDGLLYTSKTKDIFKAEYHLKEIAHKLEEIDESQLSVGQYYTTYLFKHFNSTTRFTQKEIEELKKLVRNIERKMRKEVGEDDLNELRDSIVDELDRLARRATRDLKKGKIYLKKQKAFGKEKEHTLEASSLYQRFLDIGLIDRSFVKGPVMTESYGSSTEGKAKALLEKIESSGVLSELDESTLYLVAQQITRLLEKALSSVSSSPAKYKEWMQDYAFAIVKKGDPIRWQTPLGLDVEQVDFKSKSTKVSIDGGRKVVFQVYTDELDASAHAKGLSPNYIHSLDASHLMMTVNALAQRGVTDIVTIHDSFATHANDVDLLSLTLREAFIALHKKEILSEQYDFWHEVFGVEQIKISYVDKRGFNLEDVLKSEYFFA